MGAASIISRYLPFPHSAAEGPRGLLQLCFSMVALKQSSLQHSSLEPNVLIPTHPEPHCEGPFPETFFDWVLISDRTVVEPDRPSADLIKLLVRFCQLSALVRSQLLLDGQARTAHVIREALGINEELESWERRQEGTWAFVEERVDGFFPPEAVLEGCYHVYDNTYNARAWNHYRWARILVNQLLLEIVDRLPLRSASLISAEQQRRSLECIRRLARDTLVSIPTHYRHPKLQPVHWDYFDKTKAGAVIGASGIHTLLFEIKVAGCAPGVPDRYRVWALNIMETVFRDTGMFQATVLAGFARKVVEQELARSSSPSSVGEWR